VLGRILRGVLANWAGAIVTVVTAFMVMPVVVGRLGSESYGVWIVMVSFFSYVQLLKLGMGLSLVRHISHHRTLQAHDKANEAYSVVTYIYLGLTVVVFGLILGFGDRADSLFHLTPQLRAEVQEALMLVGVSACLELATTSTVSVLYAAEAYRALNWVGAGSAVYRAVLIGLFLPQDHGLHTLAWITLSSTVLSSSALVVIARRMMPTLRLVSPRGLRPVLGPILGFSAVSFVRQTAQQTPQYADNIIAAAVRSPAMAASFSIGNQVIGNLHLFLHSIATVYRPISSSVDALGESARLRTIYYAGVKGTLFVFLPVALVLGVFGRDFIVLWVGPEHAIAAQVMIILLVGSFFRVPHWIGENVLFGKGLIKAPAVASVIEATANVGLSIGLGLLLGVNGVALGTTIPAVAVSLLFFPRYTARNLGMPTRELLLRVYGRPLVAALPTFVLLCALRQVWQPQHLAGIFGIGAGAVITIALGFYWLVLEVDEREALRGALSRLLPRTMAHDVNR
jgi:O-antigen/teichoic acid export membrane protein